ncbi:uncharacterized protein N7458_000764 [Penicillium daleae]|uniref:Uncharacterized protein n=1 Tax=Penicillium daleae TaxID=63821 RepID=A0AAD6CGS5_9EURO|nr:uncharacterized protein N7458_000764 [Penicillium daleae]KAJ5465078.1 hypothetical protein N7458_000764 [Penicillium daleae]
MPKEEVKMFNAYAQWLYTCKIPSLSSFINAIFEMGAEETEGRMRRVLYDLVILYTYNNTTQDSPIRRLLVDMWVRDGNKRLLDEWKNRETLPASFLLELAKKLFLAVEGKITQPLEESNYNSYR